MCTVSLASSEVPRHGDKRYPENINIHDPNKAVTRYEE